MSRYRSVEEVSPEARDRMAVLAQSFPSLEGAEGVDPWDPDVFSHWACREETDEKVVDAAGFLLSVWEGHDHEPLWELQSAVRSWGPEDREAFIAWCREPWWP